MIEILKRQKEEAAEDQTVQELSAGFDELDVDDFDPEEVLKMMDPEERRAFEQAVKENTLVQTIRANIEPWWHKSCAILTDDLPTLKSVPRMNPKLLERVNPIIFLSICELVATYCYIMERYLFDPDDMISEVVDDILHISSSFEPTKGEIDRDQLFWSCFDRMRLQSDDDQIALDSFSEASKFDSKIKLQLCLSDIWSVFSRGRKANKKAGPAMKKVEFYLAWVGEEDSVPIGDYVINLKQFHDRIDKEMKSFESDKVQIAENLPKLPPPSLITEI